MKPTFLHKEECPKCGSRDNVAVYSDGGRHCFTPNCGYHVQGTGAPQEEETVQPTSNLRMGGVVAEISDRRLSKVTAQKYQVTGANKLLTFYHSLFCAYQFACVSIVVGVVV